MRKLHHILIVLTASVISSALLNSCGKDFQDDIDKLNQQHQSIEQRVNTLETKATTLNTQLEQLAKLSTAVENGFYITSVATTAEGYELTLSNGRKISLYNGTGNTLTSTPLISMTQVSGLYYWSLNGMLLTDASGNPIRTTTVTPVVRYDYENLKWIVSLDGGTTFQDVNALVSVVINDTVLLEIINNYVRENRTTLFNQQMLYQIISTYIQRNYTELFNVELLDQVVATYIREHYARLFNYELLEKIFTQYDFEYYTSQIDVTRLSNLIITFMQEHQEIFTDNEVLFEIVSNYIEVNKTTIFTTEMLLEVINNFIDNHSDYINKELLTQVIGNYIDQNREVVFNTEVVRQMMAEYVRRYYTQIFSQDILVQMLNYYVSRDHNTIFNETLIRDIINEYVVNNHTSIFSEDILRLIVRTYIEENGSTIINRDVLVEVIANYFQRNYDLFIDRTVIERTINDYVERHHDTLISTDIIESVINRFLQEYYTEVFDKDLITKIVNNYFEVNRQTLYEIIKKNADPIREVNINEDICTIILRDGQAIQLPIYDAHARLRDRVQSLVIMPNASGRLTVVVDEDNPEGELTLNYLVAPTFMAEVIANKSYNNEISLSLLLVDKEGNISNIDVSEVSADASGVLTLKTHLPVADYLNYHSWDSDINYDDLKWTIALHVQENKIGATDIMTEFTPVNVSEFDERITQEIPEEYLRRMRPYMPIYSGNRPPSLEGTYCMHITTLVYDSTPNGFQPGRQFLDYIADFTHQDMKKNVVLFRQEERNSAGVYTTSEWTEAKVLGRNDNFTIFIIVNTVESDGVTTAKLATLLSGTMSSGGINNFYQGFVLLDKHDPNNKVMPVGEFRIFNDADGWSESTTWLVRQMVSDAMEVKGMPSFDLPWATAAKR